MKKLIKLILISFLVIAVGFGLFIATLKTNLLFRSADSFELPVDCKAALVYSTGRDVAERTQLIYCNKNGDTIANQQFASASDKFAIEGCDKNYNFYTNEKVFFSNGHSIDNEEMKEVYNFASDNGYDTVRYSGYIKEWGMYYKSIPHGMAYNINELGFFDILSLYNDSEIYNIRTSNLPIIAVKQDSNDVAIYCFNDHTDFDFEKTDPNIVFFEKIVRDGSEFQRKTGQIDISKATYKAELSIINAIWVGDDLYMMVNREEDHLHYYMYHCVKDGEEIRFINSVLLDWKQLGLRDEGYVIYDQSMLFLRDNVIEYWQASSEFCAPGLICYNIDSQNFFFVNNDHYDEDLISKYRTIGDSLYYLEQDKMDPSSFNIYTIETNNTYDHVATLKPVAAHLDDKLLVDFYFFE